MELEHEFSVLADLGATWDILTDVPRVARCMPGTTLDEGASDPYSGSVAVKVGAITVKFRGQAAFTERDDDNHRLVMLCEGAEVRGASNAAASVAMRLEEVTSQETKVYVTTVLQLSGKIAQFGSGMLQDVSNAILRKFVANLERELGQISDRDATAATSEQSTHAPPGVSGALGGFKRPHSQDDVIDLGAAALPALWARYGPTALSVLAILIAARASFRSRPPRPRREWPTY